DPLFCQDGPHRVDASHIGVDTELLAGSRIENQRRRLLECTHVEAPPAFGLSRDHRCHYGDRNLSPVDAQQEGPRTETGHVLETGRRLSRSMLWQTQRTLYDAQGIQAWSRGNVPQSITTSPYIARAYARVVLGYLRDVSAELDRSQPVYI